MLHSARTVTIFCALSAMVAFAAPISNSRGISNRNLLKLDRSAPHKLPKVAASAANPDTVFVVAFRVDFETDSTTLTTGTGSFDSDTEYAASYKYDQKPHDYSYFAKHLDFLKNYYAQVSDGRLVIQYSVYPKSSAAAYRVPKEMRDYGAEKSGSETWCEFGERSGAKRMSFIEDAVRAANTDQDTDNPFKHAFDDKRTVYLLIHAGASAFADGGYYQSLGEAAKTTPLDFFDFFVSQRDIQHYLRKDSLAVADGRGVKELMMVSETGNQDSVNFGINGILVNQFARQLGVPDLYGVNSACEGVSALGSFDIMDFAGYNAAMGFVPPYPSAWVRAFLGWTAPIICKPGLDSTYTVSAASGRFDNEILQVPLNENEYLLIENRQRNLPGKTEWFHTDTIDGATNETALGAPILDSLVIRDASRSDIVIDARNYEAGLPGSGVLAWHVDESVIRDFYRFNVVNIDSGRRGISLVEADGVQDIGAQFSNALGTSVQDYGQPADFFPHRAVGASAAVNSLSGIRTHDGGLSQLRIENIAPTQSATETLFSMGHGIESGKRVLNYRSESFTLDIRWGANIGNWPQWSDSGAAINHPSAMDLVDSIPGKEIIVTSPLGRIFAWSAQGIGLGSIIDSIPVRNARGDTLSYFERRSLFNLTDTLSSPAVRNDTMFVAGIRNLYSVWGGSSIGIDSIPTGFAATAGPVCANGSVYLGNRAGKIFRIEGSAVVESLDTQGASGACALAVADLDQDGKIEVVAGLENGTIVCFEDGIRTWNRNLDLASPRFAVGDIDRSQPVRLEIAVRGEAGQVYCLDHAGAFDPTYWPVSTKSKRSSQPALADIDGDRYLDIIMGGTDRVYALDRRGNALPNWPVILSSRESLGDAGAPSVVDVDANDKPDVVYGYGSRDTVRNDTTYYSFGTVGAVDSKTKGIADPLWPVSTASPVFSSIFLGDIKSDSTLQMIAVSSRGWVYAWDLSQSAGKSAANIWNGGAGSLARNPVYADSLMPAAPQPSSNPFAIGTFYCYPNPVKGRASVDLRYQLSHAADAAELTIYDQNNSRLKTITGLTSTESWNRYTLDLQGFGSAVYRAKLVVRRNGDKQVKFCKIAVMR